MKLFEILEKYTDEMGAYYLNYNEHHISYINESKPDFEKRVLDNYIIEGQYNNEEEYQEAVEDFKKYVPDFHKIYELSWYNRSPVSNYTFYGSSLELIEEQVLELVEKHKGSLNW